MTGSDNIARQSGTVEFDNSDVPWIKVPGQPKVKISDSLRRTLARGESGRFKHGNRVLFRTNRAGEAVFMTEAYPADFPRVLPKERSDEGEGQNLVEQYPLKEPPASF